LKRLQWAVVTALTLFACDVVHTQGLPPRAREGLFGRARQDANATKRLDLTAAIVEGYDTDIPTTLLGTVDPASLQSGGLTTSLQGGMSYMWRGKGAQVGANTESTVRRYADIGTTEILGHSAGVGATVNLPAHSTLFINQAAAYSPTYLYGLFPTSGAIEPGENYNALPDYAVGNFKSLTYTTDLGLTHRFSTRTSLSASGQYQYTDRLDETRSLRDEYSHHLQARLARNMTDDTVVSVEPYARSGTVGYTDPARTTEFGLNVGVEHTHRLSATRDLKYQVRIGPFSADIPVRSPASSDVERHYNVVVELAVDYAFMRTWQVHMNYRQGMEMVVDLPEPVFANGLSVGASGLLSRRVDLAFSTGYSSGASLTNRNRLQYDTYWTDVRLRHAMGRSLAVYVEGLYYIYDFRESQQLFLGFPAGLERTGVRAGVTVWLPALRK
jgi:hypothetical protein